MREIASGLWHWEAPHPDWTSSEPWGRAVSSYGIDQHQLLLLFDPIAPPDEIESLASVRETVIVLTAPWHERDTESLMDRWGAPLYSPRPDTAEDLMQKFGVTAEQAGDGSPDLAWLRARDLEWSPNQAGARLPFGVDAFPGREFNDMVLWVESLGAVISGDTLVDFGDGLEISPRWLREGVTRERIVAGLRPLLDLPVEHVLATHGGPTDLAALERVLTEPVVVRPAGTAQGALHGFRRSSTD